MNNKPIFGIDIDGCLTDTDAVIRSILATRHGITARREDVTQYEYHECLPVTPQQLNETFTEFAQEHVPCLPLLPNAHECLSRMRELGEVWIITARSNDTTQATRNWLQELKLPYDSLIFSNDKSRLSPLLSLMVEDRYETAIMMAEAGVPTLLMDYPWNRESQSRNGKHNKLMRVNDWRGISSYIERIYGGNP